MQINKNTQCISHINIELVKMELSSKKAHKAKTIILTKVRRSPNSLVPLIKRVKTIHLQVLPIKMAYHIAGKFGRGMFSKFTIFKHLAINLVN